MVGLGRLPPLASALLLSWARVYRPACCKFGSLHTGRSGWLHECVTLEEMPLLIVQNMLKHLSQTFDAVSDFLAKAWTWSIYSHTSLQYCMELYKVSFANRQVERGSHAKTSSCISQSLRPSPVSHTNFQIRARCYGR